SQAVDVTAAVATAVGDLDGDHRPDIAAIESADGSVVWFPNRDGKGSFGERRVVALGAGYLDAGAIALADLDGDGDLDVLITTSGSSRLAWFENLDGAGSFGPARAFATTTATVTDLAVADLDGDGDLDVLAASPDDGTIAWYENIDGAGTFSGPRYISRSLKGS